MTGPVFSLHDRTWSFLKRWFEFVAAYALVCIGLDAFTGYDPTQSPKQRLIVGVALGLVLAAINTALRAFRPAFTRPRQP